MQLEHSLPFLVGVREAKQGCPEPWDGSLHCLGRGIQGENPQPFHSPASQAGNCWVAPPDPARSHLKQPFILLLEGASQCRVG